MGKTVTRTYKGLVVLGGASREYIIDASSQATARAHLSKKHIEISVASGKDVAEFVGKGGQVESAHEIPPAQSTIPGGSTE